MLRPGRRNVSVEYRILIEDVSGGDIANIIRGHIIVKNQEVPFTGIAYGRYGGQNVVPKISAVAKKKLKQLFEDYDAFEEDLQLRLVEGDFDMKEGQSAHSHTHQHPGDTK